MATVDRVNIYRDGQTWCYAAWCGNDYDHSDTLDAESEDEAREEVAAMWPAADIRRVDDV